MLEYTPILNLHREEFTLTDDRSLFNIDVIHDFLCNQTYWAKGIPRGTVVRSIEGALCFGILKGKEQVGLARVVTDCTTYAYLSDVFILPEYRKRGLSKWMLETIIHDPRLQGLRRFALITYDAQSLYSQFGFQIVKHPEYYMQIVLNDPYHAQTGKESNPQLPKPAPQ